VAPDGDICIPLELERVKCEGQWVSADMVLILQTSGRADKPGEYTPRMGPQGGQRTAWI
jgi:hypothetical protein